jgi:antitoxin HicB
MRKYTIILEPDNEEGGYTVTVPALPGCITQGETIEQCIERAREAIAGYIESLIADGELVPKETERPQMITSDTPVV